MIEKRILLYGEGNFTYSFTLVKELVEKAKKSSNIKYEVIATELSVRSECENEIKAVEEKVKKYLQENGVSHLITYTQKKEINSETDDAVRNREISGKFDKIIFNFPTQGFYRATTSEKTFLQIKRNKLLKPKGKLEIRHWDSTDGRKEYEYRLACAQKSLNYKLVKRDIVPLVFLRKEGYSHISIKNSNRDLLINDFDKEFLPLRSVYTEKNPEENIKDFLPDNDFNELSDEEENLKGDAKPPRNPNMHWHKVGSEVTLLNFKGKKEKRLNYMLGLFEKNKDNYTFEKIYNHITRDELGKAEKAITVLLESGKYPELEKNKDFQKIMDIIEKKYNENDIDETTKNNIEKYPCPIWLTKLKILNGMKIPDIMEKFVW